MTPLLQHHGDGTEGKPHPNGGLMLLKAELRHGQGGEVADCCVVPTPLEVSLAAPAPTLIRKRSEGRAEAGLGGQGSLHERPELLLQPLFRGNRLREFFVQGIALTLVERRQQVMSVGEVLVDERTAHPIGGRH